MGEHKIKQRRDRDILLSDPQCYICGSPATTIDHQPPRSFFLNKSTPQEFIFSCCKDCNENSREQDQIASVILSFPTGIQFQKLNDESKEKYIKKLSSAISNSKEPFLSEYNKYIGNGYFQKRSGLIIKANDGRSREYRNALHQFGYQELSINKYGFKAIEKISYKLTCAIFKFQKNKMFGHTIGPQFDGRVFYALNYTDMPDDMFKVILEHFPLIAKIKHRQKSEKNFGFRFNYSDQENALLFSAYFGGQFILSVLAFGQEFDEKIHSLTDNPFNNGEARKAGFKEIIKAF